jgi:hypothetical protein
MLEQSQMNELMQFIRVSMLSGFQAVMKDLHRSTSSFEIRKDTKNPDKAVWNIKVYHPDTVEAVNIGRALHAKLLLEHEGVGDGTCERIELDFPGLDPALYPFSAGLDNEQGHDMVGAYEDGGAPVLDGEGAISGADNDGNMFP